MIYAVLERIANSLAAIVESRPIPAPPLPVALPAADQDIRIESHIRDAEGQSFMIEYVDAEGRSSRRRITVREIALGESGIPCITAYCHERNDIRTFRVDRIVCCIDYDGLVHDNVPQFLTENFGTVFVAATTRPAPDDAERSQRLINLVWADTILLAAVIRADGKARAAERKEAVEYLAQTVERSGMMLTPDEISRLDRRVERHRPDTRMIMSAIATMEQFGPDRIKRTLIAAARVAECDGDRHPRETALLNALALEMLGTTLF